MSLRSLPERHCLFYKGLLDSLNVSCSIAAINTPISTASQSARVSEASGLFVTQLNFFNDQYIETILFVMPPTKMIKLPSEDPSSKLASVVFALQTIFKSEGLPSWKKIMEPILDVNFCSALLASKTNLPFGNFIGGARGVVVIAVGNEHGVTSSNPGRDWLHFT